MDQINPQNDGISFPKIKTYILQMVDKYMKGVHLFPVCLKQLKNAQHSGLNSIRDDENFSYCFHTQQGYYYRQFPIDQWS